MSTSVPKKKVVSYVVDGKLGHVTRLLAESGLGAEEIRVALYLILRLNSTEQKAIKQAAIASYLDMPQPNVSRAMKRIIKKKIVKRYSSSIDKRRWKYSLPISN